MKILHVVPSLDHGGTEQLLYDILPRLDGALFETSVCCTHAVGDIEQHERFQAAGIRTRALPDRSGRLRRVISLYRFLRQERPDVVHIHNYEGNIISGRVAAILARVPVLMTYDHNVHLGWLSWGNKMMWHMLNPFTDKNVVISKSVGEYRKRCCGRQPEKIVTVLDGIDTERFRSHSRRSSATAKTALGIDPSKLVVGAFGRLIPWKRLDLLVEAAAHLKTTRGVEFVIGGDGPLETELKRLCEDLGVDARFHFLGWRSDIHEVYQALDVLVVTSTSAEGFGLVAVEAMAMEIPVVAVKSSTYSEVLGDCGILVDREPREIADAISRLIEDEDLAATMARRGRQRVEQKFDINRTVAELTSLYLEA